MLPYVRGGRELETKWAIAQGEENVENYTENEYAKYRALIDKGNNFYETENYEEAIKCYDKAIQLCETAETKFFVLINWGIELSKLAKTNENEDLFQKAFEKYAETVRLCEADSDIIVVLSFWGNALYDLAKIKQNESSFKDALDKYNEAIEKEDNSYVLIKQGIVLANLAVIKQDLDLYKKATQSFKKTGESILEIFSYFDKEEAELIIKTGVLYPLLNLDTEDGKFFNEAIKDISPEELEKYKEIYVRSVFVISRLRINREYETSVAHYTKKIIAQELLFNKSKFRLNAINNSNDPTEGKILLDYLFKDKPSKEEKLDTEYRAFVGCFTFKLDNLSQFRLYGKDQNQEGTGLSLVFHENFFSRKLKMATKKSNNKLEKPSIYSVFGYKDEDEDKKYTLFRCIYIDQKEQQVKTVGQSEITNEKYKEYIDDVFHIVNEKMEKLRNLIQNTDLKQNVIGQLLINLRYLTKHIAFKEEQECRIVRICSINEKGKIHFDKEKMFIEYESDVIPRIEKIYFGPKATNMELFEDRLKIELNRKIKCKKSENPLA